MFQSLTTCSSRDGCSDLSDFSDYEEDLISKLKSNEIVVPESRYRSHNNQVGQNGNLNKPDMVRVDFLIGNAHRLINNVEKRGDELEKHIWCMFVKTANPERDGVAKQYLRNVHFDFSDCLIGDVSFPFALS